MKDKKKVDVFFKFQYSAERIQKKDIQAYLEGSIPNLRVTALETQVEKTSVKAFVMSNLIELVLKTATKGNPLTIL